MGLLQAGRLKRFLKGKTAWRDCRVVILMYHRVFETSSDPWELCVSPKHFGLHLELLRRYFPVLSLKQLLKALRNAQLPKRGVVLTFDDGYADNLWNAKPLLEKYGLPATVFITSGSLDSRSEFWWDELERILLQPGKLPKRLHLNVRGRAYSWETTNLEDRKIAYFALHNKLQPLKPTERDPIMADLFAWAALDPTGRSDYRPLATDELIQLAQGELVDIGAHAMTHPLLSAMTPSDQSAEIAGSRKKLEDIIGSRVDTFSYPYGNLSADTVGIVGKSGFVTALTTSEHPVRAGANPFQLGRFAVGDWGADRFKRRLDNFFRS
jgi:peptidoglycan/xylan/chitin deacetylase (PgdA/CDA1 family)